MQAESVPVYFQRPPETAGTGHATPASDARHGGSSCRIGYNGHNLPFTELVLAKPNYSFEKRQRELAAKKQKDEKLARKKEAREAAKAANQAASERAPSDG